MYLKECAVEYNQDMGSNGDSRRLKGRNNYKFWRSEGGEKASILEYWDEITWKIILFYFIYLFFSFPVSEKLEFEISGVT